MKLTYLIIFSLFSVMLTGCSDCESDYDAVGVTINDFAARTGITSMISQACADTHKNANCIAQTNNPSSEYYGTQQGFVVQCNNGQYKFDLQETIHAYFPMESYKEKDDPFEKCYDYWVYDFFSTAHKSEVPLPINSIQIDETDYNIWYVSIGGTCYQWNVANSNYAVTK